MTHNFNGFILCSALKTLEKQFFSRKMQWSKILMRSVGQMCECYSICIILCQSKFLEYLYSRLAGCWMLLERVYEKPCLIIVAGRGWLLVYRCLAACKVCGKMLVGLVLVISYALCI